MTAIVGLEDGGKVYLGGDAAMSDEASIVTVVEPKVWTAGEFAFGFCDSFRFGAKLRWFFKPPKPVPQTGLEKYFHGKFVDALRETFKADVDALPQEEGRYPEIEFLIGLRGRLYFCLSDYQISRVRDGYTAIGSGGDVALGSLGSTSGPPRKRIHKALALAEKHVPSVRRPFTIVEV